MTNAEKFAEMFGTDLQRQCSIQSWWDQEYIPTGTESEERHMKTPLPLYVCNRKKCKNCSYPECRLTTDSTYEEKVREFQGENLIDVLESATNAVLDFKASSEEVSHVLLTARNALIFAQFYNNQSQEIEDEN